MAVLCSGRLAQLAWQCRACVATEGFGRSHCCDAHVQGCKGPCGCDPPRGIAQRSAPDKPEHSAVLTRAFHLW
eukprot:6807538-Alexandrium_andersonii.AAC.1